MEIFVLDTMEERAKNSGNVRTRSSSSLGPKSKTSPSISKKIVRGQRGGQKSVFEESKTSAETPSFTCKPVTVKLTRLPDPVARSRLSPLVPRINVKRRYLWKNGIDRKSMKKSKRNQNDSAASKKNLTSVDTQNRVNDKDDNNQISVDKTFEIPKLNNESLNTSEESSKLKTNEIPIKSAILKKNAQDSIRKSNLSNERETESIEVGSNEESERKSSEKSDSDSIPKETIFSEELSEKLDDKVNEKLNEENLKANDLALEENDNQNDKTIVKQKKRRRRSFLDIRRKRKRLSLTSSERISSDSEVKLSIENIAEANQSTKSMNVVSTIEQIIPKESVMELKSSRRRRKSNDTNFTKVVRIVVDRLENSEDPVVRKWRDKDSPEETNYVSVNASKNEKIENRLASPSKNQSVQEITVRSSPRKVKCGPLSMRLRKKEGGTLEIVANSKEISEMLVSAIPKEIVSTEVEKLIGISETISCEDEEDDSEIIGFLASRRNPRRARIDSLNSGHSENDQENTKNPSIGDEEITRTSSSSSESPFSPVRNLRNLSSRIKVMRAVIEDTSSDSSQDNEQKSKNSRETVKNVVVEEISDITIHNSVNDSREATNDKQNDEEKQKRVIQDNQERTELESNNEKSNVIEASMNELNCDDENAKLNDWDEVLIARKKLTALKNVMVVLTRLEDLNNLSDENINCSENELEFERNSRCNFGSPRKVCRATEDHSESRTKNLEDLVQDSLEINGKDDEGKASCVDTLEMTSSPKRSLGRENGAKHSKKTPGSTFRQKTDDDSSKRITENHENGRQNKEIMEDDVEMRLFLEERTSMESVEESETVCTTGEVDPVPLLIRSPGNSPDTFPDGILTNANGNNDSSRNETNECDEDLDEHCKRCPCDERQRDYALLKCENIPATHKCVTCNSLFKDSELLENHITSNASCNQSFVCSICQENFATSNELSKHRQGCSEKQILEKGNSIDETTNEVATSQVQSPQTDGTEASPNNNTPSKKPKKQQKKQRPRTRPRIDSLKCSVCSTNFLTRSSLSEHIFKHSAEELQEAYRLAKEKAIADCKSAASSPSKTDANESTEDQVVDKTVIAEAGSVEQNSKAATPEKTSETILTISNTATISTIATTNEKDKTDESSELISRIATVCSCHSDNMQMSQDKTDLQIEMVLFCKYCRVLFRRRECFEIHYRGNRECANNRLRGRSPRLFCASCRTTLDTWADMRQHLEIHATENSEGTVRFVCNICRVVFYGFGGLFYNHWYSHSKDSTFVASRYTFPKLSVQSITGTEKLPFGVRQDESYIFVAEHVCTICKESFSTRQELEMHEKDHNNNGETVAVTAVTVAVTAVTEAVTAVTKTVTLPKIAIKPVTRTVTKKTNNVTAVDAKVNPGSVKWYCDVCNFFFSSKQLLNDHGTIRHGRRYICISSSPRNKAYICSRCYLTFKTIREIEDHWKTVHSQVALEAEVATQTGEPIDKEPVVVTSSVNTENDQESKNRSTDSSTTKANTNALSDDNSTRDNADAVTNVSESRITTETTHDDNQESSIISTTDPADLEVRATRADDNSSKVRTLENPNVNLPPETSNANISTTLIIDESNDTASMDDNVEEPITGSYQILLNDKSSPGSLKMRLSRLPINSMKQNEVQTLTIEENSGEKSRVVDVSSAKEQTGEKQKTHFTLIDLLNSRRDPEIIQIDDEQEEEIEHVREKTTSLEKESSTRMQNIRPRVSLTNSAISEKVVERRDSESSGVTELDKAVASIMIGGSKVSKKSSVNGKSDDKPFKLELFSNNLTKESRLINRGNMIAVESSKLSFEEARFKESTKNLNSEKIVEKKQGFLRVKNLSELQAVRTYICKSCDAAFESSSSLQEHNQIHIGGVFGKTIKYPVGMTAALVLPDASDCNQIEIPSSNQSKRSGSSIVAAQTSSNVASGTVTVPNIRVNTLGAPGSWIRLDQNRNKSVSSIVPQRATNNGVNSKPDTTSRTSIVQLKNRSIEHQRQNCSGSGLATTSSATQDINRQMIENRTGQLGFHILPAMVMVPSAQSNKQQATAVTHRPTSINYLPIAYQSTVQGNFSCTTCKSFQCQNSAEFNSHVLKHCSGGNQNSTPSQNLQQNFATIAPPTTMTTSNPGTSSNEKNKDIVDNNIAVNQVSYSNWIMKDTPDGPVWVSDKPILFQQPGTSLSINTDRSIGLSDSVPNTTTINQTVNSSFRNGLIVYRCMLCKSPLYKSYPHLCSHMREIHGIRQISQQDNDNIFQKNYLCIKCPHETAVFDTEDKLRRHLAIFHSDSCPYCRRIFLNPISYKSHIEDCRIPPLQRLKSFDKNC